MEMKDILDTIVAISALMLSLIVWWQSREFNRLSVRPLCTIELTDYGKEEISINLLNKWLWPMIVKNISGKLRKSAEEFCKDNPQVKLADFEEILGKERIVSSQDDSMILLKFTWWSSITQNKLKELLSSHIKEITVTYTDIYSNPFSYTRQLDWFKQN